MPTLPPREQLRTEYDAAIHDINNYDPIRTWPPASGLASATAYPMPATAPSVMAISPSRTASVLEKRRGRTSGRGITWTRSFDRLRRGQAARPALQDEGLLIGHAPDGRQKPHWTAAHGTEEVVVAEVHADSVQAVRGHPCPRRSGCR